MLAKCLGIVLGSHKFGDNGVILKCYTDAFGLQSFLVRGVRGKGAIRPSHLMPLNLLELEIFRQENKNLQNIRELKCQPVLQHLPYEMHKRTVAMFISELLLRSIREEGHPDKGLFGFLFHSIQILDLTEEPVANFPIFFLLQLTKYLGFAPKDNYDAIHSGFNLTEGVFVPDPPHDANHCWGKAAEAISLFVNSGFNQWSQFSLTGAERSELFNKILRYYQVHKILSGELKSPLVLHEILK